MRASSRPPLLGDGELHGAGDLRLTRTGGKPQAQDIHAERLPVLFEPPRDPRFARSGQRPPLPAGAPREPAVTLHPLQQVAYLDVGIAVVTVLHFAALAEQRVGFIEE